MKYEDELHKGNDIENALMSIILGRVDSETGEIVPTDGRARKPWFPLHPIWALER